jgi:hypothetical protein
VLLFSNPTFVGRVRFETLTRLPASHLGELCRKPFLGKRLRNTRISHNAHNGRGRASGNAVPTVLFYSLFAVPAPKLLVHPLVGLLRLNSSKTFIEKPLLNTACRGIYRATAGAAKTIYGATTP